MAHPGEQPPSRSAGDPNTLQAVIVNPPSSGSLRDNGVLVSGTTTVSLADLQTNKLVYTPAGNFNGTTTFNFQPQDPGGPPNTGQDTSPAATPTTLNVHPVHDAPIWA